MNFSSGQRDVASSYTVHKAFLRSFCVRWRRREWWIGNICACNFKLAVSPTRVSDCIRFSFFLRFLVEVELDEFLIRSVVGRSFRVLAVLFMPCLSCLHLSVSTAFDTFGNFFLVDCLRSAAVLQVFFSLRVVSEVHSHEGIHSIRLDYSLFVHAAQAL